MLLASFSILFSLPGCTTEYNLATQKEESYFYSTDKEVNIGAAVAEKMESQYKIITDVDVNERVNHILDRIVAVSDRYDIVYFIKVIDEDLTNAVSLPGGYVYVFKGLIDKVESDDELAGVIAHEVGHITARHGIKRLQSSYGALLLQVLAATQTDSRTAGGVNFALTSLFLEHSQQAEYEADKLAVKYMKKAGYDPEAVVSFLQKLTIEQEKASLRQYSYWRTHPYLAKRMAVVRQEIKGKLEFRDYLILTEDEF